MEFAPAQTLEPHNASLYLANFEGFLVAGCVAACLPVPGGLDKVQVD